MAEDCLEGNLEKKHILQIQKIVIFLAQMKEYIIMNIFEPLIESIYKPVVLTENCLFYIDNAEYGDDIIDIFGLDNNRSNVITVVLISPEKIYELINIKNWIFQVTQTEYPSWTYKGDSSLEERTRNFLAKKLKVQIVDYNKYTIGNCIN
jgi:hypothetical protein